MEPYEKIFIHVLCAMGLSEDTICGIMAMMDGNKEPMDELVAYIKENPEATEAEVTKAASKIIGVE